MTNSPHNSDSGVKSLNAYLKTILPNSRLTTATVNPAYSPLTLLNTDHLVAAFAFSNGDIEKSYEVLYNGFKSYYSEQQGQLDAFDLAFVFCVESDISNLDHFCSSVETDVYFCRKFVIPFADSFVLSLSRLPFLPLVSSNEKSLRPPSAQTFLQHCGVPALLAQYLVVQYVRGFEGIIEDCISGKFGIPQNLTAVTNTSVVQAEQNVDPVRIESITIENFRAYRKPQTFEVGTDVTVLYGPNGFGKTSFFDAIDFAVTGGIGRLKLDDSHFVKAVQHLDSKSEESRVSISFRSNKTEHKIKRSVSNRKYALFDDQSVDRKNILTELTGGDADHVDSFVRLFRASHLFSQEQQELTQDFKEKCQLPAQIVSRMLAFEDYANAVNKAAKVREDIGTTIAKANYEIKEFLEQIATEKKELERLKKITKEHADIKALDEEIAALQSKIVSMGIGTTAQKLDATVIRGWRATIESRFAESKSLVEKLSILVKEVGGLPRIYTELTAIQQQFTEKEKLLSSAEEKSVAVERMLQKEEQHLLEIIAKRKEIEVSIVVLEWVRTTKPVYVQLIEKQSVLNNELRQMADALAKQRLIEEKVIGNLRTQEAISLQAIEKLKTHRTDLTTLQGLQESAASWQTNQARVATIIQLEQKESKSLESLRLEEKELLPQVSTLNAEEARLSRQITEVDKNQSELRALVSQLQGHVHTGTCPLCGDDHGTKDQLIRRIQDHVVADAASKARLDLVNVRAKNKQLAELVAACQHKQKAMEFQLGALKIERSKLQTVIDQFIIVVAKLGIVMTDSTPHEQLQARIKLIQQSITDMDRENRETSAAIESSRKAAAKIKNEIAAKNIEMNDKKNILTRLQEESNKLRSDPRLTQISLDINVSELAGLERSATQNLSNLKAESVKAEAEVTKKKLEITKFEQETLSFKSQISTLRIQITNSQKIVSQIVARLKEAKLPVDVNEEALLNLISEQSHIQARLSSLRDSTSNLEVALDAATTAAALTTLLKNIRNKEKFLVDLEKKRDVHQPWLKYFEEVSRLVSSQQNKAIVNFTRQYGPLTSVIQSRLRSVYGFDEIEIHGHETTISVRVKRQGEELRPIDYFSQSQQQTLLLGLFLTAASSQTWSTFSPIFLDDPVTHFDDLNTYAFLDLVVGLLESEVGKRQFIISTCDEKLLQLARQKFHHLGKRAKFYRFSAIGRDGPVVNEIMAPA